MTEAHKIRAGPQPFLTFWNEWVGEKPIGIRRFPRPLKFSESTRSSLTAYCF